MIIHFMAGKKNERNIMKNMLKAGSYGIARHVAVVVTMTTMVALNAVLVMAREKNDINRTTHNVELKRCGTQVIKTKISRRSL